MTYSNTWVEYPKKLFYLFLVYGNYLLLERFIYWTLKLQELIGILISGGCSRFSIVSHKLMSSITGQILIAHY